MLGSKHKGSREKPSLQKLLNKLEIKKKQKYLNFLSFGADDHSFPGGSPNGDLFYGKEPFPHRIPGSSASGQFPALYFQKPGIVIPGSGDRTDGRKKRGVYSFAELCLFFGNRSDRGTLLNRIYSCG